MKFVFIILALTLALVPAAGAQAPLPLTVTVKYAGGGNDLVEVRGTAVPGTVVSVKGATKVVDEDGVFVLKSKLPLSLVAVKDRQIRRLTLGLPSGATKWLSRLVVNTNLTQMKAQVDGALTITNHPAATVTVEHVEAGKTVRASLDHGEFRVGFPIVPRTNTLDWTLRAGWISWTAPPLTFIVQ